MVYTHVKKKCIYRFICCLLVPSSWFAL